MSVTVFVITLFLCVPQVNRGSVSYEPLTDTEVGEIGRQVKLFAKGSLPDLEVSYNKSTIHCVSHPIIYSL